MIFFWLVLLVWFDLISWDDPQELFYLEDEEYEFEEQYHSNHRNETTEASSHAHLQTEKCALRLLR